MSLADSNVSEASEPKVPAADAPSAAAPKKTRTRKTASATTTPARRQRASVKKETDVSETYDTSHTPDPSVSSHASSEEGETPVRKTRSTSTTRRTSSNSSSEKKTTSTSRTSTRKAVPAESSEISEAPLSVSSESAPESVSTPESLTSAASSVEAITETKKKAPAKRTTRRKRVVEPPAENVTPQDNSATTPASAETVLAITGTSELAVKAPAEIVQTSSPSRRSRTRSAASALASASDTSAGSTPEVPETRSESTGEETVVESKPPRRRGRPPRVHKAVEPAGETQKESVQSETQDEPVAPEVPSEASPESADSSNAETEAKSVEKTSEGIRHADYEYHAPDTRRKIKRGDSRRGVKPSHDSRDRRGQDPHRRQRRSHTSSLNREPVVPKTSAEDLAKLKVAELRQKAEELELDVKGLKKAELVEKVFEASIKAEGFVEVEGILDILQDGYGFLRTSGYLPGENDVYVGLSFIRRNGLRKGDYIKGQVRPARDNEKYSALQQVLTVNDIPAEELGRRVRFGDLTPIFPDEPLKMEHGKNTITSRVIDLVAPIGKGQRGLIVSPPKAGKTTILKDIAASIAVNNPEVHLMCLLVDERPEEVTDMERSIQGEVISSTFDMPIENHIAVSELVIERAKRLVETGGDVVILLDSLTRLARAYNLAQPASGRILSGGVDSTALYPPKRFLGAARNIEGGGSLTILASALIETGSKMDEVIFEEFKGTGNMELKLDRYLADRRIFPAIDPIASGTRKEELLLNPQEAPLVWAVRDVLSKQGSTERATDTLIKSLKKTNDNGEFLLRAAKKAQYQREVSDTAFEL